MTKKMPDEIYKTIEACINCGEIELASNRLNSFDQNHNINFQPLYDTRSWVHSTLDSQRKMYEKKRDTVLTQIRKTYR